MNMNGCVYAVASSGLKLSQLRRPEDTIITATFGHGCRRSILHGGRMGDSLLIRDVHFLVTRTGNVSSRQKEAVGCAKVLC